MSYNYDEILELQDKLTEYAAFEMTSQSEMIMALCAVSQHPDYVSDEFLAALVQEMKNRLQDYISNTEIIETEETFTRKVVSLEWV